MDYEKTVLELVSQKVTYTAAGGAVFFGLTANEVAALGGLIVAVLAMIINSVMSWHFRSEHLRLAREKLKEDRRARGDEGGDGDGDE